MRNRPNPEGFVGGSEDFTFTRTLDGHMGINPFDESPRVSDFDWRRNSRHTDEADLGADYHAPQG